MGFGDERAAGREVNMNQDDSTQEPAFQYELDRLTELRESTAKQRQEAESDVKLCSNALSRNEQRAEALRILSHYLSRADQEIRLIGSKESPDVGVLSDKEYDERVHGRTDKTRPERWV